MREYKKSFLSGDKLRIVYREWLIDNAKGNIVIIHGAGEHSQRYSRSIRYFAEKGFNVFAWDARGHGETQSQRGHLQNSWNDFRTDIHHFFQEIKPNFSELPVFLFGHSLGGLKTMDYVLNYPNENIKGYICSSAAIGEVGVSPVLFAFAKVFNKIIPNLSINSGLDVNNISRDPEWIEETLADPLYHSKGTPRLAIEVKKAASAVQANAKSLSYPILMIHGTGDEICHIDGTRTFYQNTLQQDKTLIEYEGGYHELLNDIHRQKVLDDIANWVEARL